MTESSKVVKTAKRPPNAGKGRVKGVPNKTTAAFKEAIVAVYADLQAETGAEHGHFLEWAKGTPTEFYKLAAKLLPLQVNTEVTGKVIARLETVVVHPPVPDR
jgi:hypothetical protein